MEKYKILRRLAKSNFEVYEATDGKDMYAIKTIAPENKGDAKYYERLKKEYEINCKLMFENINYPRGIIDRPETNDIYLIYSYCDEGSLQNYINKQPHSIIDEKLAVNFIRDIVKTLHFLYIHRVMHRDIKPDNILLQSGGDRIYAKLTDFDLSKYFPEKLWFAQKLPFSEYLTKSRVGTTLFLAPEIISALEYNYRIDIFSLGLTYYYMLFGVHPFCHEDIDINQYLQEIANGFITFTTEFCPITKYSIDFIIQCLYFDPNKRISMKELCVHPLIAIKFPNFANKIIPIGQKFTIDMKTYKGIATLDSL